MSVDMTRPEIAQQRQYYAATAARYEEMHVAADDEHHFALGVLSGVLDYLQVKSVLDVGAGTGRAVRYLRERRPDLRVVGVEPVAELRAVGYQQGLPEDSLIDGNGSALPFQDGEFDLVCEFAVLHHVPDPAIMVGEMLRVARRAVFISDANAYGQGGRPLRMFKALLRNTGLWRASVMLRTRGKGYYVSEGDGVAYPYSVFDNYRQVREQCSRVHVLNTLDAGVNPLHSAPQVALLGIK